MICFAFHCRLAHRLVPFEAASLSALAPVWGPWHFPAAPDSFIHGFPFLVEDQGRSHVQHDLGLEGETAHQSSFRRVFDEASCL